ncbi:MucR family transcriptional regulator [Pelagibius sp. Alg239-R121]|uniref:MucR family transcriptional regulator n=1 Tax=Pelagibius sp. Alg239-R121 TaxID=2993448 RepID=UPI0024A72174|nr:MucR family transcriptional regulator [Pelagibius sp. Alg239-R121]
MYEKLKHGDLLNMTADVVSAHVSGNVVSVNELPQLLRDTYHALATAGSSSVGTPERPVPAVPIKKSVTPDYIICLEDGKKLRVLKRYLMRSFGMSVEDYRERWNLPDDYPVVAPKYSSERRRLAKEIGLGIKFRRPSKKP